MISEKKIALPPTLLTEALEPGRVAQLKDKDKKAYNLQKSKFEVMIKSIMKRPIQPQD